MQVAVWLTTWPLPERRDQRVAANAALVEKTIRDIEGEWCADLFLVKDAPNVDEAEQYLGMSASEGRYMVTAQTGPDAFYDLIGDPDAEGEEEDSCIGGQDKLGGAARSAQPVAGPSGESTLGQPSPSHLSRTRST